MYSPSDPQEKLFEFNCHSEPISEPKEEQELVTPVDNQIELWDVNMVHNICNRNGAFAVPATFPPGYPIMSKKGVPALCTRGTASTVMKRKKPLSKQQAQPANKVPSKWVYDLQPDYPFTQNQVRKTTLIAKYNNMNKS
ncbi:hypothetical protein DSO57_1005240 [Entomophthora muscae]|uniref:Uncharacterized protein n=1 Tax=Entomophthora muscae TaxID=34485 RepID=A0ACC2U747_9FUNG|nr:hypothetical protein DSO57_1005240 [Entomophthora muscae]